MERYQRYEAVAGVTASLRFRVRKLEAQWDTVSLNIASHRINIATYSVDTDQAIYRSFSSDLCPTGNTIDTTDQSSSSPSR